MAKGIDIQVFQLAEPIVFSHQMELVDVEYVKEGPNWYLRFFIDKEGGVNISDCETISRAVEKILDEKDPIPDAYILEVSSPGLDRPLKKEKDFLRYMGKRVYIKLYQAVDGKKEFFGGLQGYENGQVKIQCETDILVFDKKDMAIVRLDFEL